MKQPDEQELILFYYDELDDPARKREIADTLESDAGVRARFEQLRRILDAAAQNAPELDSACGARVWARLEPNLPARPAWRRGMQKWLAPGPRLAWGGAGVFAVAGLLAVAFLAGRLSVETPVLPDELLAVDEASASANRVLAHNLISHVEQSQRLLTAYVNAPPEDLLDIYLEKAWIEVLLTSNRLYRSAAEKTGQPRVVAVLDEMERVLLGLRHLPLDISADELAARQELVREQGTLFRLRILERNLEQRLPAPPTKL